jgi:hypothetical protein
LAHIDDRREVFEVRDGEVKVIHEATRGHSRPAELRNRPERPLLLKSQRRH